LKAVGCYFEQGKEESTVYIVWQVKSRPALLPNQHYDLNLKCIA
jgi:hypothetical protein